MAPALEIDYFRSIMADDYALVAQGIEHRFPKAGVAGSNPAEGAGE